MQPLMPHQREGVDFAKAHPKSIIAHGMRLGKTRVAIEFAAETLSFPALVICPASLRWVWAEQIKQWAPALKVQVLLDGKDKFKRGADFHIVSYEYITKTARIPFSKLELIVVDESHYLKTRDSQRTERIWGMVEAVPEALLMSGTLIPSRPAELYTTLRMVGAINMDWRTYTTRYCAGWEAPWGWSAEGASNLPELNALLQPCMHYRTKAMVLDDLPLVDRQVIALNLPLDAREKEFDKAELHETAEPLAFMGLTDLMVFIGAQKAPSVVDFVLDLLTKTPKVVVFFQYHSTADIIYAGLEKQGIVRYDGKTSKAQREGAVRIFQTQDKCRIMLMQIKTAIGIPLWAADTTVFAEASWVPGDLDQAEARVEIIHGTPQPTFHYYMTVHRSVDEHMLRRTIDKTEIIDQIMLPN